MTLLKKLNFTDATPMRRATNGETAVEKFISGVELQIEAAKAHEKGKVHEREIIRYVNDDNGESQKVVEMKPVRPWFFQASTGQWCLAIRYGNRPLKITEDGKHSVVCDDWKNVLPTLEIIKKAAEDGELTDAINEAQKIGGKKADV